jgi:hypothetical protein
MLMPRQMSYRFVKRFNFCIYVSRNLRGDARRLPSFLCKDEVAITTIKTSEMLFGLLQVIQTAVEIAVQQINVSYNYWKKFNVNKTKNTDKCITNILTASGVFLWWAELAIRRLQNSVLLFS